ncbi:MAG: CADD family putative folate metabolism protein [Elusimicrobia bacterium]|nr:CADD family putative folate metabolism protein [Elusimicrobiota bacterium]
MLMSRVEEAIEEHSLLKHPFYQAWTCGELSKEDLQVYAKEYYHLEAAFPRFVSRVHSSMENPVLRQELTKNLISEEIEGKPHREQWLDFAEALGLNADEVTKNIPSSATQKTMETFFDLCGRSDWHHGIAALYAYERQQPQIAKTKREGLVKFYEMDENSPGLEFFKTHEKADEWHSEVERMILQNSSRTGEAEAIVSSCRRAAEALWKFLDGICEQINLKERMAVCLTPSQKSFSLN